MRYISVFLILVTLSTYSQTLPEKDLETKIESVTVFLEGAQVTRTGESAINPGMTTLIIKGLSPHLDEKSIQVKATGSFTILSVNHKFDYLNELKKDERIDSLSQLVKQINNEIETNVQRLTILNHKIGLLEDNTYMGSDNTPLSLDRLKDALNFFDRELQSIKSEEFKIDLKMNDLKDRKERIEKEISDATSKDELPSSNIEIRVESDSRSDGNFNITYLVSNAGWFPNYDVRVSSINEPVELKYKADVYQNTGVDWENVRLRFSNGNPNKSGVAPELETWYLNFARNTIFTRPTEGVVNRSVRTVTGTVFDKEIGEPVPGATVVVKGTSVGTVTDLDGNYSLTLPNNAEYLVFSFVGLKTEEVPITNSRISPSLESDVQMLSEVVVTGYARSDATGAVSRSMASPPRAKRVITTTVENQTTVEFEVEDPYSIKSNGTKLSIDLNEFEIETMYEYYAAPKLDKDAFLIARLINWDQYNLLEGEANLFFEDSYVGRSIIDANTLTDTLDLSLGRDRGIVIGREKVDDFSIRRTVGSNKIDSRGFNIIVRNNKSESIKLTLYDQIPVPAISDIDVTATEISNGDYNEESGEIIWRLNINPQDQINLSLGYEVKYPKRERVILE